jgi:hypothetical protein
LSAVTFQQREKGIAKTCILSNWSSFYPAIFIQRMIVGVG